MEDREHNIEVELADMYVDSPVKFNA